MEYGKTAEELKFSSGRTWELNRGYLGINSNLELSEGYDREMLFSEYDYSDSYLEPSLTHEERWELARYMMKLWEKFAMKGGE